MDHEMFAPQVAAMAPTYRVITWDERGFGATEYDGQPFSYWDSANDCLALLDHLGIERAVVGGMSQGGFLSLRAALTAPERVRALILLDTEAGIPDAATMAGDDLIIGDADENPKWIAKWRARDKDFLQQPFATLHGREDIHERLAEITCPALVV